MSYKLFGCKLTEYGELSKHVASQIRWNVLVKEIVRLVALIDWKQAVMCDQRINAPEQPARNVESASSAATCGLLFQLCAEMLLCTEAVWKTAVNVAAFCGCRQNRLSTNKQSDWLTNKFRLLESISISEIFYQFFKKCPAFCGTQMFITVLTRARHLSLSWYRWYQDTSLYFFEIHLHYYPPRFSQ